MNDKALERVHHPFSPSQLQGLEQCPCYISRGNVVNERAIAGTLAHKVVETGVDDARLDDADAIAAAECADFAESRLRIMQDAREVAMKDYNNPTNIIFPPVIELREPKLSVDDCEYEQPDGTVLKSTTAGYADYAIISYDRLEGEILDYKFGRWAVEAAENNLQGITYSLGLFKHYPTIQRIRFWFYQPHLNTMRGTTFKRTDIPELYVRVMAVVERARLARKNDDFSQARPSVPLCAFCGNIGRCPAIAKAAMKISQKFMPLEFPENITPGAFLSKDAAAKGMRLAQVVKTWAESFRARINDKVLSGEMDVPAGYKITTSEPREIANPEKYKECALHHLTQSEYEATLTQVFGKVEDAIKEKAPRGSKKSTVESFQQELLDSGAVITSQPFSYLKVDNSQQTETKKLA